MYKWNKNKQGIAPIKPFKSEWINQWKSNQSSSPSIKHQSELHLISIVKCLDPVDTGYVGSLEYEGSA